MSELDPSCERITFISNPAADVAKNAGQQRGGIGGIAGTSKPLFRIKASGDFGSTEVRGRLCYLAARGGISPLEEKVGLISDFGSNRWITPTIKRCWKFSNVRSQSRSGNRGFTSRQRILFQSLGSIRTVIVSRISHIASARFRHRRRRHCGSKRKGCSVCNSWFPSRKRGEVGRRIRS